MNVDVASHPMGYNPPQILVLSFHLKLNSEKNFVNFLEKSANNKEANIMKRKENIFLLWM